MSVSIARSAPPAKACTSAPVVVGSPVKKADPARALTADTAITEKGAKLPDEPNQHDILTGSTREGRDWSYNLLDDLNLDSIKAGELVAAALRSIGAAGALDATRFANSPIRVIAEALFEVAPKRANGVIGDEGGPDASNTMDEVIAWLATAPGVTGQLLAVR